MWVAISCVCVASLPLTHHTHKQFHAKVPIYGLESLNNSLRKQMCIFPPARSVAVSQTSMYFPVPNRGPGFALSHGFALSLRSAGAERDLSKGALGPLMSHIGSGRM